MKMRNRRIIAIVCAIALVIGSFATYTASTKAAGELQWTQLFDSKETATITNTSTTTTYGATFTNFQTDWGWGGDSKWQGQAKALTLGVTQGTNYKLSLDLETSSKKNVIVQIENNGAYIEPVIDVNTTEHVEVPFTAGTTVVNVVIAFGATYEGEAGTYDIEISNMKIEETSETSETSETTTTTTAPPATTDQDGYYKVEDPSQWITQGNFQLFQGYDGRTMYYKGTGSYDDMKVKMKGTTGIEQWSTQIGINYAGLTAGTEYDYTVVYSSNQAFTMFAQVPGAAGIGAQTVNNVSVVNGTNTFTGTFTAGDNPAHGQIMLFPKDAPDGTIFDFTSVTITPHTGPTTTAAPTTTATPTTAPPVQDMTITPNISKIKEQNSIWANWTNPTGTDHAYAYLSSVETGHDVMTDAGWDFNAEAVQPMTAVDKVTKTKDESVHVTPGGTYTLIVEAFNSNNQKIGQGSVSIKIPRVELQIEFINTYRQEVVKDGTTYYALFASWNAIQGAAGYKSYINEADDNHKAKSVTNGRIWSDDTEYGSTDLNVSNVALTKDGTVLNSNTTYTLIVIAYDSSGEIIARNSVALEAKPSMAELDYTDTNNVLVQNQQSVLPCAYAIYDAESSFNMRNEASGWVGAGRPQTHDSRYAKVAWGAASVLNNPEKLILNGTEYTAAGGPIYEFVGTMLQVYTDQGFTLGYNKIKVVKGDEFVTVVFRVGGATNPSSVTATEQVGVPGSILVSWVPGAGTPAEQVYRIYVDGDMKKGNIIGNNAVVNNIDAGTHEVKVVGYYAGKESSGETASVSVSKSVKYNTNISIEGFQIRSNYPGTPPSEVSFRTMCKAPKKGSTIKANGKNYTVKAFGTSYAIDTNTREYNGTNVLDASYTLLDETTTYDPEVNQWKYKGFRKYNNENRTYGYVATDNAIITGYKSGDTDNTYYAFTMDGMTEQMAYTIWVRPFVETEEGDLVYGKTTAYTSVAEIANKLYTNSMCKNETAHNYLFTKILRSNYLSAGQNPYYRQADQTVTFGWNNNLYIGFRKVPDSWNGGQTDEGQYVVVGDWKIHNSSHYNELTGKMAAASYKGNSNDEMMVRVDDPGEERDTDGKFPWNWGIQMKLANSVAYARLESGRKYKMTITYNSTKAGIMRIKTEGNGASKVNPDGYYTDGHDIVYDFDAVAGGNAHSITFTYDKNKYVNNPGADPSIVLCLGAFKVYPFEQGPSTERPHDSRSELCIDYYDVNDKTHTRQHQPGDIGGFPAGTIISDVDIVFTEID